MGDLIKRQDALTEIRKDGKWLEEQGVTSMTTHERELRDTFILREMPSAQQWIPCSERLPDEELYVLACQEETGFIEIGRLHTEKLGEDTVVVCQCDDHDGVWFVQAWMPLPEPYKRGKRMNDLIKVVR